MTQSEILTKRIVDVILAIIGLLIFFPLLVLLILIASLDTNNYGLFTQKRVGYQGKLFTIYKIRTMKSSNEVNTSVSTFKDPRITSFGSFLRRYKLDELPQLFNILIGNMSFVGPRPDVAGFADELKGEDQIILTVKPGLTGPASLFFKNEETLLAKQKNLETYNKEVIWPKKVELNKAYIKDYSLFKDFKYLIKTLF